jgi:hypothetical protein
VFEAGVDVCAVEGWYCFVVGFSFVHG